MECVHLGKLPLFTGLSEDPGNWGRTNYYLGVALNLQAIRMGEPARDRLFKEAIAAFQRALEIATREQRSEDWIKVQLNLSTLYIDQALHAEEETKEQLLNKAVSIMRQASLEAQKSKDVELRGLTLVYLARALTLYEKETDGDEGELLIEAVTVLQKALGLITRESSPQNWATVQVLFGTVYYWQAKRMSQNPIMLMDDERDELVKLLNEASASLDRSLDVFTRGSSPGLWATTQLRRGMVLQELGRITLEKSEKIRYFAEAASTYREALEILRPANQPFEWALAQNGLGEVLQVQAFLTVSDSERLRNEAIATYKQIVQALAPDEFPDEWSDAQRALSDIYSDIGDNTNAAAGYAAILRFRPNDERAYKRASYLYQNVLFEYEKAFELNRLWLQNHSDFIEQTNFAEKDFTTRRFAEGEKQIAALLPQVMNHPDESIDLRILEITILLAQGKADPVPAKVDALLQSIDASTNLNFKNFAGVRHFISQDQMLHYQQWLEQFHSAFQSKNKTEVVKVLREARERLKLMIDK
jgi:tetratricopeptide (TPR) repeat protein